jgi:hypothetical protein
MGVAPFLIINTLYTKFFYSANALTGLVWIMVIPLVTIALLVLYLHKYTYDKLANNRPLHVALLTLPTAVFLFIPLVFLTNINLMLFPDRWSVVGGFLDALSLPNVFPRYFHFINASLTVTSLFLFYWISRKDFNFSDKFKEYSLYDFQKRFYTGLKSYGSSKSAQLHTVWELAPILGKKRISINAMHPGAVQSDIGLNNGWLYRLFKKLIINRMLKKVSHSADALYFLASEDKDLVQTGHYYYLTHKTSAAKHAMKSKISKHVLLWTKTILESL